MLKSLHLTDFTVFTDTTFEFSPGLNVVIGDNGTGKTHLLKAAYAVMTEILSLEKAQDRERVMAVVSSGFAPIFQVSTMESLCRQGYAQANIRMHIADGPETLELFVKTVKKTGQDSQICIINAGTPNLFLPVFIPVKETLSVFPGFTALYEEYHIAFDRTYYTLCKALARPLRKKLEEVEALLASLENIIGGKAVMQDGRFYFRFSGQAHLTNINMIAEGHRKIALLAYLIANNSLKPGVTLFWDEPETNLNPRLMKDLAAALVELARHGVQVVLATHSLFLMKELDMQSGNSDAPVPARFFSLVESGENTVTVEQGNRLTELETIVSLDETLTQYDREHEAYYRALEKGRA